ncbi:cysteine-rich KTR domain-containing protein [Leuconostoc falkenbergense]|uniref:cysteine-rich KTR domain-containing protein n=1 Tax=Leuconostoc falkenbergense TaxID=2766470 RepID=UPI0039906E99
MFYSYCKSKIPIKITCDTKVKNFFALVLKCKHKIVVHISKFKIKIKDPGAKT